MIISAVVMDTVDHFSWLQIEKKYDEEKQVNIVGSIRALKLGFILQMLISWQTCRGEDEMKSLDRNRKNVCRGERREDASVFYLFLLFFDRCSLHDVSERFSLERSAVREEKKENGRKRSINECI